MHEGHPHGHDEPTGIWEEHFEGLKRVFDHEWRVEGVLAAVAREHELRQANESSAARSRCRDHFLRHREVRGDGKWRCADGCRRHSNSLHGRGRSQSRECNANRAGAQSALAIHDVCVGNFLPGRRLRRRRNLLISLHVDLFVRVQTAL